VLGTRPNRWLMLVLVVIVVLGLLLSMPGIMPR
jgi:hypothetical protein